MNAVYTDKAPQAIGPYSQAIKSGSFVFTSGQIPINPLTGTLAEGGIESQADQVCRNLDQVLKAAGSSLEKAVKTTCYLKNISDFNAFNAVYEKYFVSKPARSCFEVSALPKGALLEVEVVAEI